MGYRSLRLSDRGLLGIDAYLHSGDFGGTGTWVMSPAMILGDVFVSGAVSAATLYAWPFVLPVGGKIVRTQIRVTTLSAGALARVGIYRSTGPGLRDTYPKKLVQEFAEFSAASTGVKADVATLVRLAGGVLYWAAFVTNSGAAQFRLIPSTSAKAFSVWLTSGDLGTPPHGATVAQAYGALPDPFPAGGTLTPTNMPLIGFQLAR